MFKAVFLDLDDTLIWDEKSIDSALKTACAQAEKTSSIDPEQLEQAIREQAPALFPTFDTTNISGRIGVSPLEGLWADASDEHPDLQLTQVLPQYRQEAWLAALKETGIDDLHLAAEIAAAFKKERRNRQFVYDDTYQVLHELQKHYQLLLLTNGLTGLQQTKLNLTPALAAYFDHIVISGSFGKGKPDPAIFNYACGLVSVRPDEALMVGDNLYTDIAGATRAGIPSVWLNHHAADAQDVRPTYEISQLHDLLQIAAEQ